MRILCRALILLLLATPLWSQTGGHIGLASDSPGYSDCNLNEALYVINYVYVVHSTVPEANTSQFKVLSHYGAIVGGVSYGGNLHLGDIFTGVTVTYVGCKPMPYLIATISFVPVTPAAPCVALEVVPDPVLPSGQIEVVDCNSQIRYATGGILCVDMPYYCCTICGFGMSTAMCAARGPTDCYPIATEESTWGKVKSLYQ